jgi:F0F1-type ATP synthase assembly protein I
VCFRGYKLDEFSQNHAGFGCYKLWYARPGMERSPRESLDPAGAGAVLLGTTAAGIGVGALVGWAAGSWPIGALVGAILGIPGGVFAVYRRYRDAF